MIGCTHWNGLTLVSERVLFLKLFGLCWMFKMQPAVESNNTNDLYQIKMIKTQNIETTDDT